MKKTNWIVFGAAIYLVPAGCSPSQKTSSLTPITASELSLTTATKGSPAQYSPAANNLQIKLKSHSALRGAKIQVDWTSKNTMVLRGTGLSQRQKRRAGEIANKLESAPVANELQIRRGTMQ